MAVWKRTSKPAKYQEGVPKEWKYWVEASDRGIGMTVDTIINYYLKAGASFRNDPAWGKQFADAEGKPTVTRSGRFGIGVFATFLLGDMVQVTTRHGGEKTGVSFTASPQDENVRIDQCDRAVGPTVRVRVSPEPSHQLQRINVGGA